MHLLPLSMTHSCQRPKKPEGVVFHVQEVVAHSDAGKSYPPTKDGHDVRLVQSWQNEESCPYRQEYPSVDLWPWTILKFSGSILLEKLLLDRPEKPVLLKRKPWFLLYWGLAFIKFGQNSPGFILVEVVGNEMLSDVLALGHGQPVFSSRMFVDIVAEIIQLVFNDPEGVLITPKLAISLCFLFGPVGRTVLDASCRERLFCDWHVFTS